jgi:hypothetical protein
MFDLLAIQDISWAVMPIADRIEKGSFLYPSYINNDWEVDLFVLNPKSIISW